MIPPAAEQPDAASCGRAAACSRRRVWACLGLLLAAWYVAVGPRVALSQWTVVERDNVAMAEAMAWLSGRMDLPHPEGADLLLERRHDTALVAQAGKVYNVMPPLLTFLFTGLMALENLVLGVQGGVIGPMPLFFLVVLPLVLTAYWAFRTQISEPGWAAFMAFTFLVGTSVYPMMVRSGGGNVGYLNHLLSQTGLLLIAGDLLGKRRFWPAAIGLLVAGWSRQLTLAYLIPMGILAWRSPARWRGCAVVGIAGGLAIGAILVLNHLKFGSGLESGYPLIYEGRTDVLALRCREGLFAIQWLPDNLAILLWQFPLFTWSQQGLSIAGHATGNSLIFSTPVVILVLLAVRHWWRDSDRKFMMLATVPVIIAILLYHAPGFHSNGCYRFAMDWLPVWFLVAAPVLVSARWRWWTMGLVAWSAVYFQMLDQVLI